MSKSEHIADRPFRLGRLGLAAAAVAFCLGLLGADCAFASYEQVATFAGTPGVLTPVENEEWSEEVQLGGLGGMAVNVNGAGGVPAGTVYSATQERGITRVAMFEPLSNGGLRFAEAWEVDEEAGAFTVCGPVAEKLPDGSEPPVLGELGELISPGEHSGCSPRPIGGIPGYAGVAVDQATGNVYAYGTDGEDEVVEYTATGKEEVTRFGIHEIGQRDVAETPSDVHSNTGSLDPITVGNTGVVYLSDDSNSATEKNKDHHRVMVFRPHNGDYADYEYAGEIAAGPMAGSEPDAPALDNSGDLYAVGGSGATIEMFARETPTSYTTVPAVPVCVFAYSKGGIESMTVDPTSHKVFFFSYKEPGVIHRLGACSGGSFVEEASFLFTPKRGGKSEGIYGLAFDPLRTALGGHPAGVLYAGSDSGTGGKTKEEAGKKFSESALGYEFVLPPEVPPVVEGESVFHVTATTAELSAEVNPKGFATHYVFQYETVAAYEANPAGARFVGALEAPPGGGGAGAGVGGVPVTAALSGLPAGTAYRVRIVAISNCSLAEPEKLCEADGEALAFRTFPLEVSGLSDHRAYELVSPPDKHGGDVLPIEPLVGSDGVPGDCGSSCKPGPTSVQFPRLSATDGETVVYEGAAFDTENVALEENEYISRRNPETGWQTESLAPAQLTGGSGDGYKAFSADLDRDVFKQTGVALTATAPGEYGNFYSQPIGEVSSLTAVLAKEPPNRSPSDFRLEFAGASADLSRVFFIADDALTTEVSGVAPAAVEPGTVDTYNLYEWDRQTGGVSLVNVLPGNAATQPAPGTSFPPPSSHPVSTDGSRVFFADASGQVYVRENSQSTTEIDTEGVPDPGKFLVAASDGSAVLLADGHLHYLEGGESTVDLTQGKGGFAGVVGESEDLSHVYFVDSEVLTGGEANENCEDAGGHEVCETAVTGKDNLYAWVQGEGTRFIGKLDPLDDANSGRVGRDANTEDSSDWGPAYERSAEASPNGRYLAFVSVARLTGQGNIGAKCHPTDDAAEPFTTGFCQQAFIYDSATHKLVCASCNPSGEQPLGRTYLPQIHFAEGLASLPRYLTDDGRLYFDSADSIVPADTNGGIEDVYEYEPQAGAGEPAGDTCGRGNGCVSLISAGTGSGDSNFVAADSTGANVFFTTRDRLSPRDGDELFDLYDARENGGLPEAKPEQQKTCQESAVCQPPVSVPADLTPSSWSFVGIGNLHEQASVVKPKKGKAKPKPKSKRKPKPKSRRKSKNRAHKSRRRTHKGGR